VKIFKIF